MNPRAEFFNFVSERHAIWYKRHVLKQPYPWSSDPIFNTYKFTNVYRELDRGTIYLYQKVKAREGTKQELYELYYKALAYRFLNNADAFEAIGGIPGRRGSLEVLRAKLHRYKEEHGSVFNTAYRVLVGIPKGTARVDAYIDLLGEWRKSDKIASLVEACRSATTYRDFCVAFTMVPYVGEFLSYELGTDMRRIDKAMEKKFTEDDWANIGPGAKVGLSYILGVPAEKLAKNEGRCLDAAQELRAEQKKFLPNGFPYYEGRELTLRDIEHSLCEYGKYMNIKTGIGRSRPFFTPEQ